jgi:ribosomal protein S18 acetylase RimI-like enzyme
MVELVAMSEADFHRYLETAVEDYAQAHLKAGDCDPAEARELAKADYEALLPHGVASRGQHLFTVSVTGHQGPVGMVWFEFRDRKGRKSAYIYDIQVDPAHRGKGYGAQTLRKTEELAAKMGAERIGLNVMGWNHIARKLYEKSGFTITGMGMTKALSAAI